MSKLIYYTFNNMYCILAFYVRFIKARMNPRKKAETSKQIFKTDQYLARVFWKQTQSVLDLDSVVWSGSWI